MVDLSERMFLGRIDRPDEWTMDDYARDAKKLEVKIAELEKEAEWLFDFALGYTNAPFLKECLEALKEGV
jgi:hypothetical protein